jgi:hypothetical protein
MATITPRNALKVVNSGRNAHLNLCRLLHGSACFPKRYRAPDRSPINVVV